MDECGAFDAQKLSYSQDALCCFLISCIGYSENSVGIYFFFLSSQMEYTCFPWASVEPPRAAPCGVSPISFLPQESRIFHLLGCKLPFTFPQVKPEHLLYLMSFSSII